MNLALGALHPYPFDRLRTLFAGVEPPAGLTPINMGIGEPQHPTPTLITDALSNHLGLLGKYPLAIGMPELRQAIASWLLKRYGAHVDPAKAILPVSGTREALFAFAQAVIDRAEQPVVLVPNPFYQIYEGAALLSGAEPFYVPTPKESGYRPDWSAVPAEIWPRVQLAYVCSPGNPTGAVLGNAEWREIFDLADRYGFVIAADECYSEIYPSVPPVGALEAAKDRGFERIVVFNSLSKRSSAPGLRSGFVAGDPEIIGKFLLYRTYHGAAPSGTLQMASVAAWNDEAHVEENRAKYRAKFDASTPILAGALGVEEPDGAFFLWARVPGGDDQAFAKGLYASTGVTVIPGSFLARDGVSGNPGVGHIRIALVPELDVCVEAITRIAHFAASGS